MKYCRFRRISKHLKLARMRWLVNKWNNINTSIRASLAIKINTFFVWKSIESTHTHTHTHTYVYIYIYIYIPKFLQRRDRINFIPNPVIEIFRINWPYLGDINTSHLVIRTKTKYFFYGLFVLILVVFCVVSSFITFRQNFTSGLLQVIYCDLG